MFIRKKTIRGVDFYQIVENARVEGKVRQRVIASLGQNPTIEDAVGHHVEHLDRLRRSLRRVNGYPRQVIEKDIARRESALAKIRAVVAPVVPASEGMPPMPSKRALEAVRAQLEPECRARFDEEVEAFAFDLEYAKATLPGDRHWHHHRSMAECYIEGGGPGDAVPCPRCKDADGLSRGHDDSHPIWARTCRQCYGKGWTGFNDPPRSASEPEAVAGGAAHVG